jgi:hypothetical protein
VPFAETVVSKLAHSTPKRQPWDALPNEWHAAVLSPNHCVHSKAKQLKRAYLPWRFFQWFKLMLTLWHQNTPVTRQSTPAAGVVTPSTNKCKHQDSGWLNAKVLGFMRFPFNNFTYYFTLFSKFFSSFPHGTCSLSVSRHYLALDEIYHPFCTAIPNNATLWTRIT